MLPSHVMTSRWWAATSAAQLWPLLLHSPGWPRWWRCVRQVHAMEPAGLGGPATAAGGLACDATRQPLALCWRLPAGLWAWQPWVCRADETAGCLQAHGLPAPSSRPHLAGPQPQGWTWVLQAAPAGGTHITFRWQITRPAGWRAQLLPWVELHHFAVMRQTARALADRLGCAAGPLQAWSGGTRR